MDIKIVTTDPFHILSSTKSVVENLKFITINEDNINDTAKKIATRLEKGLNSTEMDFGNTGTYEDDVQLVFIEDVVNFCFWAEKGKPKWQIEYPLGNIPSGGWYSLVRCFHRALENKIPILDANFLISLTLQQVREIFKGELDIDIPLVEKRLENLREAGHVLHKKFDGKFVNALEYTNYDTIKIVKLIYDNFKSFQDNGKLNGKEVFFLKRAQICAQDVSYVTETYKKTPIKNLDSLTAFADYKLPQMLRKYGVITYKKDLAEKIDNYVLIHSGSQEEIEIRSTTIWCIELIRQKLKKYTSADIDNALWLLSQAQTGVNPYHRTYTIFY